MKAAVRALAENKEAGDTEAQGFEANEIHLYIYIYIYRERERERARERAESRKQ
jgi:hypothetical protein